ncbi:MAG: aminodeoxychorismate/anthranilate synthase component II [Oscillospiraceae bacterium]|jgi:anthranilate synthase component 2|nr:aminodeoxychorismate/anthranilate synthase component II [Oscillospiraceae bacterium]
MTLIIDNYDSFTYNLYQLAGEISPDVRVVKNDEFTAEQIAALGADRVILSPGPGRPADAGVTEDAVRLLAGRVPILGVCLGHQAICEVFGAEVTYAKTLMHGKRSAVHIASGSPLFLGLPPIIEAGRYHSLAAARDSLPDELLVVAEDEDGEVMAVKHREYEIYGVQFHPESILTPDGRVIMENFLAITEGALK